MNTDIILNSDWDSFLEKDWKSDSFKTIIKKLKKERAQNIIFPTDDLIFNALNKTPLAKVKVVILGQDPYHGKGQAHGLSFSVPNGIN